MTKYSQYSRRTYGVVGYHVRFTRERPSVRTRVSAFFISFFFILKSIQVYLNIKSHTIFFSITTSYRSELINFLHIGGRLTALDTTPDNI